MTEDIAITASYTWTVDEYIASHENNARACFRRPYQAGLIFLALMAIFAGWVYYSTEGWGIPAVLLPLGGVYVLFLRRLDKRIALRRQFKRRPDRNTTVVWTMRDDDFQLKTSNTDCRSDWSQITRVRKARNGLLLHSGTLTFCWLPFHAFSTDEQREAAEALLGKKVKDFKLVT